MRIEIVTGFRFREMAEHAECSRSVHFGRNLVCCYASYVHAGGNVSDLGSVLHLNIMIMLEMFQRTLFNW